MPSGRARRAAAMRMVTPCASQSRHDHSIPPFHIAELYSLIPLLRPRRRSNLTPTHSRGGPLASCDANNNHRASSAIGRSATTPLGGKIKPQLCTQGLGSLYKPHICTGYQNLPMYPWARPPLANTSPYAPCTSFLRDSRQGKFCCIGSTRP